MLTGTRRLTGGTQSDGTRCLRAAFAISVLQTIPGTTFCSEAGFPLPVTSSVSGAKAGGKIPGLDMVNFFTYSHGHSSGATLGLIAVFTLLSVKIGPTF